MIKAVLFDFDGTLADSSEGIFSASRKIVKDMGYDKEWTEDELRLFIGPPLKECFRVAFHLPEDKLDEAVSRYREIYNKTGYLGCHLYDGMYELLETLKSRGIKLGVASNKEQRVVEKCIEHLGVTAFFDGLFGTDLAGKLKKVDVIEHGCNAFSLKPEEVLMVGDTENDRLGAISAKVNFTAVTWGFGYTEESHFDNISHINEPKEVLDIINKINGGKV